MARNKLTIHISQSADQEAVQALLSAITVLIIKLTGNDTTKLKGDFKTWVTKSSSLLLQMGIKKEFTRMANILQLHGEFYDEDAIELGKLLNASKVHFEKDATISYGELAYFKKCITYLRSDSASAWRYIEQNVTILGSAKLNTYFTTHESEVVSTLPSKSAVTKMQRLAMKLTGKTGLIYPKAMAELRKDPKNIPIIKEYGIYAKEIREAVKIEIRNYVRKTGKPMVTISELKTYLDTKNLPNSLPTGFLGGQIDDLGNMYTREGRQLERNLIGVVHMNPNYDPAKDDSYVLIGDETWRVKTLNMNANNKEARFNKVTTFFNKESAFRKEWLADLSKVGKKEQVYATMIELLYKTSCRIGGKANATAGEPTYGLTTLQVRHLKFLPNQVEFNYSGKKSHDQHHVFKTSTPEGKHVRATLQKLVAGKSPTDIVFTFQNKPITAAQCNSYLRSHGIGITAHYFRRLTGTKMGMDLLKKSPFKKGSPETTQKAVDNWVLQEFKKVGEVLHHNSGTEITGKTALKSYVSPEIMIGFYTGLELRVPTFIPSNKGKDKDGS